MKILVDHGAEVDGKTDSLDTPLHYAAKFGDNFNSFCVHSHFNSKKTTFNVAQAK